VNGEWLQETAAIRAVSTFVYRQDRVILLYAHARAGKLSEPVNRQTRRSENYGLAGSLDRDARSKGTEMSPHRRVAGLI
jgi:hypothetical protein